MLAASLWHSTRPPVAIIVSLSAGSLNGTNGDRCGFGLILGLVLFSGPAMPVGHRGLEA